MRKSRFFQKDAYISVDFLEKEMEIVQIDEKYKEKRTIIKNILLLKSAFTTIDKIFQDEMRIAEENRSIFRWRRKRLKRWKDEQNPFINELFDLYLIDLELSLILFSKNLIFVI